LNLFKNYLTKRPFDVVLENPHIIKPTQIKVLSLSKGPDNVILSSKYTNRDSENYMQSLGQAIINVAKIVPHGVLIFFPSYKALEMSINFWQKNNLYKQMGDVKSIFLESKSTKECNETVLKYYERIKDRNYNGAIMFAVCRGKISEGIDFADNYGRAVIITGLPFPLFTDPRVILKRQYLDENKSVTSKHIFISPMYLLFYC
jgi:regulator of telomere elongation helicase 1